MSAVGTCSRCGGFYCEGCKNVLSPDRVVCETCVEQPGVDHLRDLELRLSGRRDGFVWWFGIFGTLSYLGLALLGIFTLVETLDPEMLVFVVIGGGGGVICVAYLLLRPWARVALFVPPLLVIALSLAHRSFAGVPGTFIGVLVVVAAFTSARNQLAFSLPVERPKLEKLHRRYYDNQIARVGFFLALLGLLVPVLELIALPCSIVGLRRVDPTGYPPVGRKGTAIAGIVLSVLGLGSTALMVLGLVG